MSDSTLDFGNGSWEEAKGTIFTTLRTHDNKFMTVTEDVADVKTELAVIKGYGQASAFWGKLTTAVVGIGFTAVGLILAYKSH